MEKTSSRRFVVERRRFIVERRRFVVEVSFGIVSGG